jgi:hypothetical protein
MYSIKRSGLRIRVEIRYLTDIPRTSLRASTISYRPAETPY